MKPLALGPSLDSSSSYYPNVIGSSFSFRGDGGVLESFGRLFRPDDNFTDVTLENWDLSNAGRLDLPQSVQNLHLIRCNLHVIPEEVRALENVQELNLAENQLRSFEGILSASRDIRKLNASHNRLEFYDVSLPRLTSLDLSSNALVGFPDAIFVSSQLDTVTISANEFEIAAVSAAQYDFFAGLSDFQATFANVLSCTTGSLLYLQGNGVCQLDLAAGKDVDSVSLDRGFDNVEEPMMPATVHVAVPTLSDTTKKYIVAAIVVFVVAGIVGGVIALISLGVVGGIARAVYEYIGRWLKKRHRNGIHEKTPLFFDQAARAGYQREMEAVDKLFPSNDPVLVTWRIDFDSVTLIRKIAQGAFGEVWMGQYRHERVAVKQLIQEKVSLATSEAFLREIKLMAWLEHPKIVLFVGVAWTRLVDMLAVIEYMDGGDLRTLLEKNASKCLPWEEGSKLRYARDTIDAIVYLHSLNPVIIHRDLKSRNILLDSNKGAKLGDFGESATKRSKDMTAGVGTTRWLAPEIVRGDREYTEAVDIYSFGVILSELDTHELPFSSAKSRGTGAPLNDMTILQGISSGKLQVSLSSSCPQNLQELSRKCMSLDPAVRPTAAQVAYTIRSPDLLL
uniref:Protein kinase domain-containing protein n=1 Tax=Peronospora matthiolae TaxID=2874970 RepID=A0AAV1TZ63_9STRA